MSILLPPRWTQLRYHEQQARLWRTTHRFVGVAAGRGSGKTELARRRVIRMLPVKKPWPDPLYFYALPTRQQAKRVAWNDIKSLVPKHWIKGEPNESEMRIDTIFGSTLYVVGMDKPQRIEGNQWDGGVQDEACDQKPGSFDRSIVPALTHRNGWCWRIGVPKRFGVGAKDFKEFCHKPGVDAYSWKSSEIVTEEQLAWAKENLSQADFDEQYGASWLDPTGLIFHAWSQANIKSVSYNPDKPIIIGSDFNVDPMAWVLCQEHGRNLCVFDEIYLRNTNTPRSLDALFLRYGHKHLAGYEFYGDASGRARKTSASMSDYLLIANDDRFKPKRVLYLKSNPPKADRFAACNALMCNGKGERHLIVDPRCRNLITDIETRAYKEGTNDPNDHDDIGHITDALGYVIHRKYPIRAPQPDKLPGVLIRV